VLPSRAGSSLYECRTSCRQLKPSCSNSVTSNHECGSTASHCGRSACTGKPSSRHALARCCSLHPAPCLHAAPMHACLSRVQDFHSTVGINRAKILTPLRFTPRNPTSSNDGILCPPRIRYLNRMWALAPPPNAGVEFPQNNRTSNL
jgi:hypothetical protein